MNTQITFTAVVNGFKRLVDGTLRLTLDLYPHKGVEHETFEGLIVANFEQKTFQTAMIALGKDQKEGLQIKTYPQSDEQSKKMSEVLKEFCRLHGRNLKEFFSELRETYGTEHLRNLPTEDKKAIIDFYQDKIDEVKFPEK